MDRHCQTALSLAHDLRAHPLVDHVYYPGLADNPQHVLAASQMKAFGGMIALELKGGLATGKAFLDAASLVMRAVSPDERPAHGFTDGLIRLSVGLEDYDDLHGNIMQALDRVGRQVWPPPDLAGA